MFFPYYFDRTILLVLVGMAIVGWAQWRVSHVYKKTVDNGSWYIPKNDPQLGLLDTHGAANTLTRDIPTSNLAQGNVSSGASVSVAKYTGPYSPAEPVELPRGIH